MVRLHRSPSTAARASVAAGQPRPGRASARTNRGDGSGLMRRAMNFEPLTVDRVSSPGRTPGVSASTSIEISCANSRGTVVEASADGRLHYNPRQLSSIESRGVADTRSAHTSPR